MLNLTITVTDKRTGHRRKPTVIEATVLDKLTMAQMKGIWEAQKALNDINSHLDFRIDLSEKSE